MVNEFRTRLLNLSAWIGTAEVPPGEEYVPPDFTPAALPAELERVRAALFGTGPDRAGRNITLARLLSFVHASQFAGDVTASDARITYDPRRVNRVFDSVGPTATGPAFVGWSGASGFSADGRAYGRWTATTDGGGGYTVTPFGLSADAGTVTATDAGDAVPLTGSLLKLVVPTGGAGTWNVTLLAPPIHSFVALADEPDVSFLFRPSAGGSETAWFQAWSESGVAAVRAAAVSLALAARVSELGN